MVPASGSRLTISRPRSGDRRPDARYRCSRPPQLGYSRPPVAPLIAQPPPRARKSRLGALNPLPERAHATSGSAMTGSLWEGRGDQTGCAQSETGLDSRRRGDRSRRADANGLDRAHRAPARVGNKWTDIGPMRPAGGSESPPTLDFLTSGRPDSNRGPHRPKRCALPGCATPRGSRRVYRPGGSFPDRRGAVVRSQAGQT